MKFKKVGRNLLSNDESSLAEILGYQNEFRWKYQYER